MNDNRRLDPPFRAEHVGSLLRPAALTGAFRAFHRGEITEEAFHEAQDRAIDAVVRMQEDVGLRAVTDGEFRRGSYWSHFVEKVAGLEVRSALFKFRDDDGCETDFTAPHVAAKVRHVEGISTGEFAYLKSATRTLPKITMPSPPTMHFWRGSAGIDPAAYDGAPVFFDDLASVYRAEIAALSALGARYLQIDEVPLAMLCDPEVRAQLSARGEPVGDLPSLYIGAINAALADRPKQMTVALHLCRGNFKGQYLSAGGYEAVAEQMFSEIEVDAFFLEYDTPRAGDFAPLRFVPPNRTVILGLVSSKRSELETVDHLHRRVDEAAQYLPLQQLGISPQCGFASTVAGNPITADIQNAKLRRVVEAADTIWQ